MAFYLACRSYCISQTAILQIWQLGFRAGTSNNFVKILPQNTRPLKRKCNILEYETTEQRVRLNYCSRLNYLNMKSTHGDLELISLRP